MTSLLIDAPSASRIGAQRPRLLRLPEGIASVDAGRDAVEFAESLGLVLDDWQEWLVEQLLAERVDGSLAATTGIVLVPRQNGKNVVLAVVELYGLCIAGLRRQVHSAHLGDTATEHRKYLTDLIVDNALDVDQGGYLQIYEANGKERIVNTETRGELSFVTRTKSTKRGTPPQRIVFDEALFLTDEQTQAMLPALAAQSMRAETSPQIIVTSSAPLPSSITLSRMRANAIANSSPRVFLADWGCEPDFRAHPVTGVDIEDVDLWYEANPGFGLRIAEEFIRETELNAGTMTPQAFAIERLGVVFGEDGPASELPEWGACKDGSWTVPDGERPGAVAVDIAPDLSWSSIAVGAVRPDGKVYVELVEHLVGTDRTVGVLTAMWAAHRVPVQVEPRSSSSGVIEALRAGGVEVVEVGALDFVRACAEFRIAVKDGTVAHRGQGPLDAAVGGAAVTSSGDAWKWARRSSQVDISPLVAVTLALHAARLVQVGVPSFTDLSDYLEEE